MNNINLINIKRKKVVEPFLFVLPSMPNKGILVSEPHGAFLASKFLVVRMNLAVHLDICDMFQADLALPLSHSCVPLPVVAQTFLQGEKMFPAILLRTYQLSVTSKNNYYRCRLLVSIDYYSTEIKMFRHKQDSCLLVLLRCLEHKSDY